MLVTAIQEIIYCSVLEAGQPHSVLTWHEVALHRFQTSLKELSTLPPIFAFKKLSERGFAHVGHAKENKSLLGIGGSGPSALEVITGCLVPAADSTVGNFRGFFAATQWISTSAYHREGKHRKYDPHAIKTD